MAETNLIQEKLQHIPELPGIYKMLDARGNIIYIGKSKCLKKRVKSYFVSTPKWEKVTRMVSSIKDIEYIVTDTHLEARLLECRLIKELKPRFNAQMKNDQNYVYLKLDPNHPSKPLSIVQEREEDCFGPFRSKYALSDFITRLNNLYPIKKSGDCYEFEYHLFPVKLDQKEREELCNLFLELFSQEENILKLNKALQLKLEEAAAQYRYEIASMYRDLIQVFTQIKYALNRYQDLSDKNILLKLPYPGGYKLFFVANGHIIKDKSLSTLKEESIREFIQSSLLQSKDFQPTTENEKSLIDYRDILYSEILDLDQDMWEIIP